MSHRNGLRWSWKRDGLGLSKWSTELVGAFSAKLPLCKLDSKVHRIKALLHVRGRRRESVDVHARITPIGAIVSCRRSLSLSSGAPQFEHGSPVCCDVRQNLHRRSNIVRRGKSRAVVSIGLGGAGFVSGVYEPPYSPSMASGFGANEIDNPLMKVRCHGGMMFVKAIVLPKGLACPSIVRS